MNRFLSCLALASVFSLPVLAHADTYTLQDFRLDAIVNPRSQNPSPFYKGAFFTLNTTTGVFTAGALDGFSQPYGFDAYQYAYNGYVENELDFSGLGGFHGPASEPSFDLILPVASLVGYQGGIVCSLTYCNDEVSGFNPGLGDLDFVSGTLTPVGMPTTIPATPEPSSLILLGTGILGVVGAARRRFAK